MDSGLPDAEPVIISYPKGLLKQFPGVPEGIVDVIPVDLVVAALIAIAAKGPDPSGPTVFQVASGARNPLHYGQLVDLVERWFTERPLYDPVVSRLSSEVVLPRSVDACRVSWPGQRRPRCGERLVNSLPLRGERARGVQLGATVRSRESPRLRRAVRGLQRDRGRFRMDRTIQLLRESLTWPTSDAFCFDPAVIDWPGYIEDVHLPSVVEHARSERPLQASGRWRAAKSAP